MTKAGKRGTGGAGTAPSGRRGNAQPATGKNTGKKRAGSGAAARRNKASARTRRRPSGSGRQLLGPDRGQNTFSMFLAALVVLILLVAVSVNGVSLRRRLRENNARALELQQEIRAEEQRREDIEEYRRYTSTNAYIEEVAREKLGLIYEGEIVFKEQK